VLSVRATTSVTLSNIIMYTSKRICTHATHATCIGYRCFGILTKNHTQTGYSNGFLSYWITDENVSTTEPVYSASASQPFPDSSWVQLVIIHTRSAGVLFYIHGQNVPAVHERPPAFPPDVRRNMLNFNGGRKISGSEDRCVSTVDDRTTFAMSDFYIWNRCEERFACC
jgi:hypothetical protein